ncbi:hypothetical protein DFH06DRAFT_140350 [Mycena polygramma]|nr:hypothetical protein DFH06DRAFT_140350 [Mycena polygramma]
MDTAANIMNVTGQIVLHSDWWSYEQYTPVIYLFCNSLPHWEGWIHVVLATGWLTARGPYELYSDSSEDGAWVHEALDCIAAPAAGNGGDWDTRTTVGVAGLLSALIYYRVPVDKNHIYILLRALELPGHPSENAVALLVHDDQFAWFQDQELQPILQDASVWSSIMHIAVRRNQLNLTTSCIHMGYKLVQMTYWKPQVLAELCPWLTIFLHTDQIYNLPAEIDEYSSVLERACLVRGREEECCGVKYNLSNGDYRAFGLLYRVLCNIWGDFKATMSEVTQTYIPWLRCTTLVVKKMFSCGAAVTYGFLTMFCVPLRDSLLQAATLVRHALGKDGQADSPDLSQEWQKVLESFAKILEDIANQIPTDADLENGSLLERRLTVNTRAEQIEKEIDHIETVLKTIISTAVDTVTAS